MGQGLDMRVCWIFDVFRARSGTEEADGDGEEGGWEGDG